MSCTRSTAIYFAKEAMRSLMTRGTIGILVDRSAECGETVYSFDYQNWHVMIRPNGAIVSALNCDKV